MSFFNLQTKAGGSTLRLSISGQDSLTATANATVSSTALTTSAEGALVHLDSASISSSKDCSVEVQEEVEDDEDEGAIVDNDPVKLLNKLKEYVQ